MRYDTIDLGGLAERLVAARKGANVTQEAAAAHLGISRPTFIAMEKGSRRPRPDELVKLAEFYKTPLNKLLREDPRPMHERPHLRSMLDPLVEGKKEVESAVEALIGYVDDYRYLEGLLKAETTAHFPPRVHIPTGDLDRFAEHCAQEERARLKLGAHQPIRNLRQVVEEAGLHVFMEDVASKLAGLYVFVREFGYCILVNRKHSSERRRWTIAHEYAHFLVDRERPGVDFLPGGGRKQATERFADLFASAFLLPAAGVQEKFYEEVERSGDFKVGDLCRMADFFVVSLMAMSLRMEALGLIPRGSWDAIAESRVSPGKLKTQAGASAAGLDSIDRYPHRYKVLAVQAFVDDQISEGQLAKLLRCARIEAREIVQQLTEARDDSDATPSLVPIRLTNSLLRPAAG